LLAAGGPIDAADLARRHELAEEEVTQTLRALEAFDVALGEDLAPPLPLPAVPEDYELLGELGRGGMGVVYRAHQHSLDREVALKVLRPGELLFGESLRRFQREARSLAKLRHRHIVSIHEVGDTGAYVYYSMDLIEGGSLAGLLNEGPLTAARSVRILRQVASAVAYSHGQGVVHRDLKPGNVLLDSHGDSYVADFGLAQDLAVRGDLTSTGRMLGTPDYMAPEQARGDSARIGEACDVYALGAILYACLTGVAPFEHLALADKIHAVVYDDPVPPRKRSPVVPRGLEVVCLKALTKDPEKRYPTVQAMLQDLERFEEGHAVLARLPGPFARLVRALDAQRPALVVALVMGLLFTWTIWGGVLQHGGATPATKLEDAQAMLTLEEYTAARALFEAGLQLAEREGSASGVRTALQQGARDARLAQARSLLEDGNAAEALAVFDAEDPYGALAILIPPILDSGHRAHAQAVQEWAARMSWDEYGGVARWLAEQEDYGVPLFAAFLCSFDVIPDDDQKRIVAGLFEHGAIHDPALRRSALNPLLEQLKELARDESREYTTRAISAQLVSRLRNCVWMFATESGFPVLDEDLELVLEGRTRGHAGAFTRATLPVLLSEFLAAQGSYRYQLHNMMSSALPEGVEAPFWPFQRWRPGFEPPYLAQEWTRLISRAEVDRPYHLRLAQLGFQDGAHEPTVLWERVVCAEAGKRVVARVHTGPVVDVATGRSFSSWIRVRWFGLLPSSRRRAEPGALFFDFGADAKWGPAGFELLANDVEQDFGVDGSRDSWSVHPVDLRILPHRVKPLLIREYGWPRHGAFSTLQMTVAWLEEGEYDGSTWDVDDWRHHLDRCLAEGHVDLLRDFEASEAVLSHQLEAPQAAALADSWLAACFLPMPDRADDLRTDYELFLTHGRLAELYGRDREESAGEEYDRLRRRDAGPGLICSAAPLLGARLRAGDGRATRVPGAMEILDGWHPTHSFWTGLFQGGNAPCAAFALEHMESPFTPNSHWPHVERAAAEHGIELPEWARVRIAEGPGELAKIGRAPWIAIAGTSYALLLLFCGWLLTFPKFERSEVFYHGGWALWLAIIAIGKDYDLLGVRVPLQALGFALAALASWRMARLGSRGGLLAPAAFGLGFVIDLLARGGSLDVLAPHLPRVALMLGFVALPLLSRSARQGGPARTFGEGPWPVWIAWALVLPVLGFRLFADSMRALDVGGPLGALSEPEVRQTLRRVSGPVFFCIAVLMIAMITAAMDRARFEKTQEAGKDPLNGEKMRRILEWLRWSGPAKWRRSESS